MRGPYPVTIVSDRYGGCYSGAAWTAWNLKHYEVPDGAFASDCECATFWQYNIHVVGFGNTPQEAYENLCLRLSPDNPDREQHGQTKVR